MSNASTVYLLMLHLDGPRGAREIASMLGIDEHTAAKHLRGLEELSLVRRCGYKQGYVLCSEKCHALEEPALEDVPAQVGQSSQYPGNNTQGGPDPIAAGPVKNPQIP
jgi:hypothetical protein